MKIGALTVTGTLTAMVALAVLTTHQRSWGQAGGEAREPAASMPPASATPGSGYDSSGSISVSVPALVPAISTGRSGYSGSMMGSAGPGQNELRNRISSLVRQLRQAEDQEAQEKITDALRDLFSRYFDADLEARQKQIGDLKERIAQLESQIEKRRQAKDEIIGLQLKVIRNEAEGLGFFSELTAYGLPQPGASGAAANPPARTFGPGLGGGGAARPGYEGGSGTSYGEGDSSTRR